MTNEFLSETNKEYLEFLNSKELAPPKELSEKVLTSVHKDLNPNAWFVFAKLSLIHLVSGVFTLSLCPQFGTRIFGDGIGLMKFFASLGNYGCMAACGAVFIGVTLLLAGVILKPQEVKKLRQYWPLEISAIILLSLGAFIMADAEILVGYAVAWFFGSLIGGFTMLELGWWFKKYGHAHR